MSDNPQTTTLSDKNMRTAELFDTSRTGELTEKELSDVNMYLMPFLLEETERSDRALLISKLIQMVRNRDAALQVKDAERERAVKEAREKALDELSALADTCPDYINLPAISASTIRSLKKGRGE